MIMRVSLKNIKLFKDRSQIDVVKNFINHLQSELPLNNKIRVTFLLRRNGNMTTGVRRKDGDISILVGDRLLIDILRTLSHEWVHEYQFQKLNLNQDKKIQDIGGTEENMANVLSGIIIKKFQKLHPNLEKIMYNE